MGLPATSKELPQCSISSKDLEGPIIHQTPSSMRKVHALLQPPSGEAKHRTGEKRGAGRSCCCGCSSQEDTPSESRHGQRILAACVLLTGRPEWGSSPTNSQENIP